MLIDINASFGGREGIQQFRAATMLDELKRIPYRLAFVHCRQGMVDAASANEQTLALCREHPRLRPTGVIHPRDTFTWRGELDRCLAAGVRLFRLYPDEGGWPVDSVLLTHIVDRLAGTGAALLLEATAPGLPSAVAAHTAEAALPVIFTDTRYFPLSELLPLAERYPHLFIETSRLTSPEGIEHCVAMIGAERLLFGTGTARYPAWVAWQLLERAAISPEERATIAWRNAARLLDLQIDVDAGAQPAPATETPPEHAPVIDVHLHDKFPGAPVAPLSAAAYEAALEQQGVTHGVCSSITAIFYDLHQGNNEVANLVRQIPRLRGYVVVDPRYPDDSADELRRLDDDTTFVGVKIHAAHARTSTRADAMRRLFAAIAPYGKPVLIHNLGEDWPEALVDIAAAYPHLPIIAAHAGYGDAPHPTHDAALRLAPAPNIFLEFCSTYLATGAIRRGIEAVGLERMLFGSDFPLISLSYMRTAYDDAGLMTAPSRHVLRRNAVRLFPFAAAPLDGDAHHQREARA